MKNSDATTLLHDLKHASAVLREEYSKMDAEDLDSIKPNVLAARTLDRLDPESKAPFEVRALAHATLAHMSGGLCANFHRAEDAAVQTQMTISVFDAGLQPRYPVTVDGVTEYKKRALMTVTERRANAARLRTEGESKVAHATALDAETDEMIKADYFDDEGTTRPLSASTENKTA